MMRSRILKQQSGFTMIEIIAVLILIGILAAVAVPKFLSMTEEAELKSVQGVKAELVSRANQYFAKYLLTNDATGMPRTCANWATSENESIGDDFQLTRRNNRTLRVTVAATGNRYNIEFTNAVYSSGDNGTPAKFGNITPN